MNRAKGNSLDRAVKLKPAPKDCPWLWHQRMELYLFAIRAEFRLRIDHLQLLYFDQVIDFEELKNSILSVYDLLNEVDREYDCKYVNVATLKTLALRYGVIEELRRLYDGSDEVPSDDDWNDWLSATEKETAIIVRRGVYNYWLKTVHPSPRTAQRIFRISRRYKKFKRQFINTAGLFYDDLGLRTWLGEEFAAVLSTWGQEPRDYEHYFLRNLLQRYFACPIECQFNTCKPPCNSYCHRTGLSIWAKRSETLKLAS